MTRNYDIMKHYHFITVIINIITLPSSLQPNCRSPMVPYTWFNHRGTTHGNLGWNSLVEPIPLWFCFSQTSCHTKIKAQSALLFMHSWRECSWIHVFPKDSSATLNANSLIQDLNSASQVYFTQWTSLYYECHYIIIIISIFVQSLSSLLLYCYH